VYLARTRRGGKVSYVIRESYPHGGGFLFRELFDLGADPGRFIVYPGGNAFYIDGAVAARLEQLGAAAGGEALEDLFWPFLRLEIRRKLEAFRRREQRLRGEREARQRPAAADAHPFDRRRVHYLKCGRMNVSAACTIPDSALRRLQGKSRDEIEQDFIHREAELQPRELKAYTYVIFNLQQFFSQRFSRQSPEFLDPQEVDAFFIEEACRLNRDRAFWLGMDPGDSLHGYLVRYLIMHFDNDYAPRSLAAEYVRDFMNRHRAYRPPPSVVASLEEMSAVFGSSREELKRMTRSELTRHYRRRARELHPDTEGGDHERFVKLADAYDRLLRTKR
jgi:hypothetical protein